MNRDYEVYAQPHFITTCPKHRNKMNQLINGILGEYLWYCGQCDRPYRLKLSMLRENEFNREALDKQVKDE